MTAQEIERMVIGHAQFPEPDCYCCDDSWTWCDKCQQEWPCDVQRVLDAWLETRKQQDANP